MKKTLLSFLFLASLVVSQAQDAKPSKDETQRFLNSMLKDVLGKDVLRGRYTVTKQSFKNDFNSYTSTNTTARGTTDVNEVSPIDWAKFEGCTEVAIAGSDDVIALSLNFSNKVEIIHTDIFGKLDTQLTNSFQIFVPRNKKESVLKASWRLSKITKEENKDPFEN